MNKPDIELPPLPTPDSDHYDNGKFHPVWKQRKMEVYARAAIEADRKQRDNEWKLAVDHELTTMQSTADSYDSPAEAVSALIDWHVAVATDPVVSGQQRGEPVAYLRPDHLQQIKRRGSMFGEISAQPRDDLVGVFTAPQPADPVKEPSVPECPYPCGWESLHKLAVHDGAYLARTLDVGQILTDNQRDTAIVASLRLIEVCRAMLEAAPKFGEEE